MKRAWRSAAMEPPKPEWATMPADTTGNGRMDLIVTHLDLQLARLYQNMGDGTFDDATFRSKISYDTFHLSGFGARFLDFDNDGRRDIFIANGHVLDNVERYHPGTRYAEPKLMFRNWAAAFLRTSATN